jgi:hypothetical protein
VRQVLFQPEQRATVSVTSPIWADKFPNIGRRRPGRLGDFGRLAQENSTAEAAGPPSVIVRFSTLNATASPPAARFLAPGRECIEPNMMFRTLSQRQQWKDVDVATSPKLSAEGGPMTQLTGTLAEAERTVIEATKNYCAALVAKEEADKALASAEARLASAQSALDTKLTAMMQVAPKESPWARRLIEGKTTRADAPRVALKAVEESRLHAPLVDANRRRAGSAVGAIVAPDSEGKAPQGATLADEPGLLARRADREYGACAAARVRRSETRA